MTLTTFFDVLGKVATNYIHKEKLQTDDRILMIIRTPIGNHLVSGGKMTVKDFLETGIMTLI